MTALDEAYNRLVAAQGANLAELAASPCGVVLEQIVAYVAAASPAETAGGDPALLDDHTALVLGTVIYGFVVANRKVAIS